MCKGAEVSYPEGEERAVRTLAAAVNDHQRGLLRRLCPDLPAHPGAGIVHGNGGSHVSLGGEHRHCFVHVLKYVSDCAGAPGSGEYQVNL